MTDTEDLSKKRIIDQICLTLKGKFLEAYSNDLTIEFMVNPDQSVYVERLGEGITYLGKTTDTNSRSIIYSVSGYHNQIVDFNHPICEGEFPLDGSRFEGLLPPLVAGPSYVIRKKASSIFTLNQYVESGTMTKAQKEIILQAVTAHQNILVCGGTGSGKTTLINGIIDAMVKINPDERVVIIEDTGEIQCSAQNHVQMRSYSYASMTDCLRATLRYRPDRILVGEVRGGECLDLLDAWNTGHPGGAATIHANDAHSALNRVRSLVSRNPSCPDDIESMIAEAVNVVVCIARFGKGRKIKEIIKVLDWDPLKRIYLTERIA